MSGVSIPVTRPSGRALIVASAAARAELLETVERLGYGAAEVDDPYSAIAELCRRPLAYRAMVISLGGLYREELTAIATIKRRFPHVEIWLTHTDGRQAALADAMRHGADGLLSDEGLHRIAVAGAAEPVPAARPSGTTAATTGQALLEEELDALPPRTREVTAAPDEDDNGDVSDDDDGVESELGTGEPVLTAEELRALLQEQPMPPGAEDD